MIRRLLPIAAALVLGYAMYAAKCRGPVRHDGGSDSGADSESARMAGTYVGRTLTRADARDVAISATLELRENLRCYLTSTWPGQNPVTATGTYSVDGDRLILDFNFQSKVFRISGDRLLEGTVVVAEMRRTR